MVDRELRLVGPGEIRPRRAATPAVALGVAALTLGAALCATILGADVARRPADPRADADATLNLALERGADDPSVRSNLRAMRRRLGSQPLDSRTRVAYAAALAGLATSTHDLDAAAFHADVAARGAPVSVPVIRGAVHVLVRARDLDGAIGWLRGMFGYDAPAAARLLLEIEPLLPAGRLEEALAPSGDAWLAWARTLRRAGRGADADASLADARALWPTHVGLLVEAGASAYGAGNVRALGNLLPPDEALPDDPRAAFLYLYRAVVAAERGDPARARADLRRGLGLAPRNDWLRVVGGDVLLTLGAEDEALAMWSGLRYSVPGEAQGTRIAVLRRIARVDEARGQAGAALRSWREILSLAAEDAEARRRVAALTGARGQTLR